MSKQNTVTIETLDAERVLLEQAVAAGESLIVHLETGISNRNKAEAARKTREAIHWMLDAQSSLAVYTARFKEEEAKKSGAGGVQVEPPPANVINPNVGSFSGKPPEGASSHAEPSVLPVGSTEAGAQAQAEEAAALAPETPPQAVEAPEPANSAN